MKRLARNLKQQQTEQTSGIGIQYERERCVGARPKQQPYCETYS